MLASNEMNWYVLFVRTGQEEQLCNLIRDDQVNCFSVKMEFYKRVTQTIELQSLFPGYVICQSHLDQLAFDEWLMNKPVKKGFIKQLKYEGHSSALLPEEIAVFKRLLNAEGVLKMSYGVKRNRRFHITEGPLLNMDEYIVKYDAQHKLATLDLYFIQQNWQAGIIEVIQ